MVLTLACRSLSLSSRIAELNLGVNLFIDSKMMLRTDSIGVVDNYKY